MALENAFQAGTRKIIPAVLIYAKRGSRILMIRKQTHWNGLGGKCEADESPLEAARREFHEEAGVDLGANAFRPLGVLHFPNFKPLRNEDWMVFVFQTVLPDGLEVIKSCDEGDLHWIEMNELEKLPLWEGDRQFLPWVSAGQPFMGTFWYRDGKVERSWLVPLNLV